MHTGFTVSTSTWHTFHTQSTKPRRGPKGVMTCELSKSPHKYIASHILPLVLLLKPLFCAQICCKLISKSLVNIVLTTCSMWMRFLRLLSMESPSNHLQHGNPRCSGLRFDQAMPLLNQFTGMFAAKILIQMILSNAQRGNSTCASCSVSWNVSWLLVLMP